jgi:hypothetical protein
VDGHFGQQQAILRTLPTSTSLMADSLRLWWVWRERGKSGSAIHRRSLFLFLLALTFTAITLAAGVFSSYVVSSSDLEVLVVATPIQWRLSKPLTHMLAVAIRMLPHSQRSAKFSSTRPCRTTSLVFHVHSPHLYVWNKIRMLLN